MTQANDIKIAGVQPYSSIDWPGKLAAVAFLQGCPWKCPYCHNPQMQSRQFLEGFKATPFDDFKALLAKRHGLLDGVVFSGGEPTLDPALPKAVKEVKDMGFAVGLHTSGCYPEQLKAILPMLDWVGLDVKMPLTDPIAYRYITGLSKSTPNESVRQCLGMILAAGIDFECRTTAHPVYLPENQLIDLARELSEMGVRHWALQIYRCPKDLNLPFDPVPLSYPSVESLLTLKELFETFEVRRG